VSGPLRRAATLTLRKAETVAPLRSWGLLGGVYVVAVVLNIFRYWQYGPDTRFYLAWAYKFGGLSEMEAGRRTYEFLNAFDWFKPFCWGACSTSDPTITYDWLYRGEEGGLVAPRIVYPLLSAPFVRLFGPPGLLVWPLIGYTVTVVLTVILASRIVGRKWAVVAGLGTVLPGSITMYAVYAYTDALAMAFCVACLLFLPLGQGRHYAPSRRDLLLFGTFLTLFAFTRQFHLIVVGGVLVAWLCAAIGRRALRNEWLPFVAVGVGLSAVIFVVQSQMSSGFSLLRPFLEASGAKTASDIPGVLPSVIGKIISGEIILGGHDFGLVLVAVLAAAGLITQIRRPLAQFTLGMLAATFGLELLTALPSFNRYWALSLPLLAILGTVLLKWVFEVPQPAVSGSEPESGEQAKNAEPAEGWELVSTRRIGQHATSDAGRLPPA
jgi:hypothetical protein